MDRGESDRRSGIGFDAHELTVGRELKLGGHVVPFDRGLAGHSDGDVLLHAIIDALLGALALPDIGSRYPDSDPELADVDSRRLLQEVLGEVRLRGYRLEQVDCVLVCDRPRIQPYRDAIVSSLSTLLALPPDRVGLKAKSCEGTALAIPGSSLAALAIVQLASGR